MRTLLLLLTTLVAAAPGCSSGRDTDQQGEANKPPTARPVGYEVTEQWAFPNGGYGKVIVIKAADANEAQLRALGEELKEDTRGDRNASISVFSDKRAAGMRSAAIRDALSKTDAKFYDDHLVAGYTRNINNGYHTYTIMPSGLNGPQVDIKY